MPQKLTVTANCWAQLCWGACPELPSRPTTTTNFLHSLRTVTSWPLLPPQVGLLFSQLQGPGFLLAWAREAFNGLHNSHGFTLASTFLPCLSVQ